MEAIENKLDYSFGPSVRFAGYFMIFGGILVIRESIIAFVLILIGIFIGFSISGIIIDMENNRIKYYTKVFWIYKQGNWRKLSEFNQLILLKNRKVYTTHSRSNRTIQTKGSGYYIYLVNSITHMKTPIKKCKGLEEGKSNINWLSEKLDIPIQVNNV